MASRMTTRFETGRLPSEPGQAARSSEIGQATAVLRGKEAATEEARAAFRALRQRQRELEAVVASIDVRDADADELARGASADFGVRRIASAVAAAKDALDTARQDEADAALRVDRLWAEVATLVKRIERRKDPGAKFVAAIGTMHGGIHNADGLRRRADEARERSDDKALEVWARLIELVGEPATEEMQDGNGEDA